MPRHTEIVRATNTQPGTDCITYRAVGEHAALEQRIATTDHLANNEHQTHELAGERLLVDNKRLKTSTVGDSCCVTISSTWQASNGSNDLRVNVDFRNSTSAE